MSDFNKLISSSDSNIRQHIKNCFSKLLTGLEFPIKDLENSYRQMAPAIHQNVFGDKIDIDVLDYCLNRIPPQIFSTKNIILGQNREKLISAGYGISSWKEVISKKRRRRSFYSSDSFTLVSILTSDTDLGEIVNILIAIEIEFNKIKTKLNQNIDSKIPIYQILDLDEQKWLKFSALLKCLDTDCFKKIKNFSGFNLKLVNYAPDDYSDLVTDWWQNLLQRIFIFDLKNTPVYFISSNLHSLLNIIGGYVNVHQTDINNYLQFKQPDLYQQLKQIESDPGILRKEDYYYYASSKYFENVPEAKQKKQAWEENLGIKDITLKHDLFCDAQVIPVSTLVSSQFIDPALNIKDRQKIANSKAVIINIDYPLGYTAYLILSEILKTLSKIAGIYIVGKAAILQGEIGDIQIPNIVFDERLNNVIKFDNCFNIHFPVTSKKFSVLNNQKAISVQNVILENKSQIDNYLKLNFNIIEMESGSYLTAIAQKYNYQGEFPHNQVCKLSNLPFDLGIVNYASDNPLSSNIGQSTLAMRGVGPAYASLLAIVQRIIDLESLKK